MARHVACLGLIVLLAGCTAQPISEAENDPPIHNLTVGQWTNRYHGDPNLAGVVVQQFPDCAGEALRFEGHHPALVLYVFKDGRVNQIGFEPDGKVRENFWWRIKNDDPLWKQIRPVGSGA